MPKVKVHNDNIYPYEETFKGEKIHIPAKGHIEMEYGEAIQFKGTFNSPVRDADGNDTPKGYKMIRVEEPPVTESLDSKLPENLCLACRYLGKSKADLLEHVHTAHSEQFAVDADAEKEVASRKRAKAG